MVECKLCNNVVEGPAYVSKCEKILHIKCATKIIGDGGSCKLDKCPYRYYVQLNQDNDFNEECEQECQEELQESCCNQCPDDCSEKCTKQCNKDCCEDCCDECPKKKGKLFEEIIKEYIDESSEDECC